MVARQGWSWSPTRHTPAGWSEEEEAGRPEVGGGRSPAGDAGRPEVPDVVVVGASPPQRGGGWLARGGRLLGAGRSTAGGGPRQGEGPLSNRDRRSRRAGVGGGGGDGGSSVEAPEGCHGLVLAALRSLTSS